MRQCRKCGHFCSGSGECGRCQSGGGEAGDLSAAATLPADAEWVVVARFANAAEAGYFANELDFALGIEPRLECCDDFDAIQHHWRSGFALAVPSTNADAARTALQDLLDSDAAAEVTSESASGAPLASFRLDRDHHSAEPPRSIGSQIKWGPLLLTLAAGSLVIWHSKKPAPQRQLPDPRDALRVPLRDAPGLSDSAWIQSPGGGVRRELVFPPNGGAARLRVDQNGDGVFESEYAVSIEEER